jgi:hypothetical protein
MFDPARKREAFLPRTNPLGKSERLYFRRSSLQFDRLPFFIQDHVACIGTRGESSSSVLAAPKCRYSLHFDCPRLRSPN